MKAIRQLIQKSEKSSNRSLESLRHLMFLFLLCGSIGAWAADYVFISNETNGYFINSSAQATQTFSVENCVWSCINTNNNTANTLGGTSRRLHIGDTYLRGRNSNNANSAYTGANNSGNVGQWRAVNNYLVHYYSANRYVYNNNGTPYWNNNNTRPDKAFGVYSYAKKDEVFTVAAITGVGDVLTSTGTFNLSSAASYTPEYYTFTGPDTRYYASGITKGAIVATSATNAGITTKTSGFTKDAWTITPETSGITINSSGQLIYTTQVTNDTQITITHTVTENGKTKSAEKTITLLGTTVNAPTITPGPGQNQYTITGPTNSTIKYTINGQDIDASGSNGTTYSGPVTVTTPNTTIKAKAVREGKVSAQTEYTVTTVTLAAPTITISDAGSVTITNSNGIGTIHYTTDGSEPTASSSTYSRSFNVNNMATVKAIVTGGTGYTASTVASKQYKIESSVSGGVVTLNDYEDHNWTYYSDSESPIKSLYPRNVKITYYGYGTKTMTTDNNNPGANNMADVASTAVGVSMYESENTFVYYKTLERYVPINNLVEGTPQNIYPYDLIPNPFSKRPTYGTNATTKWRGFYGWRVKSVSGGKIYSNVNQTGEITTGTILTTEYQKLYFLPNDAGETNANNATSMTVEFEAIWARAYRVTTSVADVNTNLASTTLQTGVSYERNFLVINDGNTNTTNLSQANQRPVTVMMVEPDGSSDYRTTGRYINPAYVIPQNNLKFEWMNMRVSNTLSANAKNLVVGRGVLPAEASGSYTDAPLGNMSATGTNPNPTVTANRVNGLGSTTSDTNSDYSTSVNFYLRLESGVYGTIYYVSGNGGSRGRMSNSATCHVTGFFGNDYDRAKNNNDRMVAKEAVLEGTSNGFNNTSSRYLETMHLTMKSGIIGTNYNKEIAGGTYAPGPTNACYIAVGSSATACGLRRFIVEGGSISCITGGMETWGTADESIKNNLMTDIRVKYNSIVRSAAFGGPANAEHFGLRRMVYTGGQVFGWVAGACNGNSDNGGQLRGATQVYVGGNAIIGDKNKTADNQITVNGSKGGNVFGAGRGRTSSTTTGEVTYGTNVVVADDAYIVNNVYGGGDLGYALTTANVHVLGGEVMGGVFGGANAKKGETVNIVMRGGLVHGGVYGGSNSTGTISGNVTMQINGGQVGTSGQNANIHGGGYGQPTIVSGNVNITLGATGSEADADGVTVYGDVYGGSALGSVNGTTAANTYHTNVTMNAGYIHGSLYGGALGATGTPANVYGPVQVKVYGGSVMNTDGTGANGSGAVYGANNINGAPQRSVTVDIYGTNSAPAEGEYALFSVYGGGNAANYTYGNGYPKVTVHNCDNSIEYVYGGGNAAAVAATDVTIYGGNKIGNVFGGGNGQVKAANVTGNTNVKIYGGTIGDVYGGSNTNGTIGGTISVNVNAQGENGSTCPINIDNVYGGGNKAPSNAGNITIGCAEHIGAVYGGANQANITGNINLAINAGHIDNVFGGNNQSGDISGTITVTVNDNGSECGMVVGNVYGGGNQAAYGHGTNYPVVNIQNGHLTGSVFGGGLGETAVVVGNPTVNIGDWINGHSVIIGGDVFGGGDLAAVEGNPTVTIRDCGTLINGDLYGGGNAAPVYSTNTTMWGGTVKGNVFGGGNGADPTKNPNGAQVGYDRNENKVAPTATITGNATLNVFGGTIGTWDGDECTIGGGIFGGSNTKGNIAGTVNLTLDARTCTESGAAGCTLKIKEVYGAGNEAAYVGTGINFNLGCVSSLSEIYGGAKNADMNGDIHLIISSGRFNKVFGGNNIGGRINGSIKVTIDETGCEPVIIDELYGCGNNAAYSVYGYNEDGTVKTSGTNPEPDPEVNIISFTHIGKVFGGGYGAGAVVAGNPTVNINVIPGKHAVEDENETVQSYLDAHKLGSIGTVFGGGNAANVVGNTSVNIGTESTNAHIEKEGDSDIDTSPKAVGANITGNVYGGGNAADVTGKTNVVVGQPKTTPVTP